MHDVRTIYGDPVMKIDCSAYVQVAELVSGTNAVDGTCQRLAEALDVADCCRQKKRFDLATELLDQIESFPAGKQSPLSELVREQRGKIADNDTSGDLRQIESEPQKSHAIEQLPPLWIRGWNFANSMAKWSASGFPIAPREVTEQRLAICHGCEYLVNDACSKCGCPCTGEGVLDKLTLATESCPEGKW